MRRGLPALLLALLRTDGKFGPFTFRYHTRYQALGALRDAVLRRAAPPEGLPRP